MTFGSENMFSPQQSVRLWFCRSPVQKIDPLPVQARKSDHGVATRDRRNLPRDGRAKVVNGCLCQTDFVWKSVWYILVHCHMGVMVMYT